MSPFRHRPVLALGLLVVVVSATVLVGGPLGHGGDGPTAAQEQAPSASVVSVEGNTSVTVTYRSETGTGQFRVSGVDPALVDTTAEWAYLPRSRLPAPLQTVAGDPASGVVPVGKWALVGDLAAATQSVGNGSVRVVAPAGMAVDPARKAGFLAAFMAPYRLAPNATDRVTLLVAPDGLPGDGRMYGTTGYVTQHAFWDGDVASVWIHEYVHARQRFATGAGMAWLREASATYLSSRVLEEQFEGVDEAAIRARLAALPRAPDRRLANASAAADAELAYTRGVRVLYALDASLRAATDGERTLVDVIRVLNRYEAPVTVADFLTVVDCTAERELEWVEGAIRERGALEERLDTARASFDAAGQSSRGSRSVSRTSRVSSMTTRNCSSASR